VTLRSPFVPSLALVALAFSAASSAAAEEKRFSFTVEGGALWQSRNTAQIPNDLTGTRFSLRSLTGDGPNGFIRFDGSYSWRDKHQVRVLVAPLTIKGTGVSAAPIRFDGQNFATATPIRATYRFDSYRVTYRYKFYEGDGWRWWGGATIKLRDANVKLEQGALREDDPNTGPVPLISLYGTYAISERLSFVLDFDGLIAPQGRAFDIAAKLDYALSDDFSIGFGYRMLEGGADNDDVYTFAWLHYALVSASYRF
jgi:hypothetical protein